nr:hypothetical protein CFP56_76885 [Quercus suber]
MRGILLQPGTGSQCHLLVVTRQTRPGLAEVRILPARPLSTRSTKAWKKYDLRLKVHGTSATTMEKKTKKRTGRISVISNTTGRHVIYASKCPLLLYHSRSHFTAPRLFPLFLSIGSLGETKPMQSNEQRPEDVAIAPRRSLITNECRLYLLLCNNGRCENKSQLEQASFMTIGSLIQSCLVIAAQTGAPRRRQGSLSIDESEMMIVISFQTMEQQRYLTNLDADDMRREGEDAVPESGF